MPFDRSSGILLHPTSLPGPYGIGELGPHARRWVDFLEAARQQLWQLMPLGPTGYGDSPYQCFSAFAGNPYLISLERLVEIDLLTADDLAAAPDLPAGRVDFGAVIPYRTAILIRAFERFVAGAGERAAFEVFCAREAYWLDDYALFMALKEVHGGRAWNSWEEGVRSRHPAALGRARRELAATVERQKFWQYLFFDQWLAIRRYANARGIRVIGDIPIFVSFDSADVWANPELFHLGPEVAPTVVAGVPPDHFSKTGQRWGNPLYRWDRLAARGFDWWIARFRSALVFFDIVRLDHFCGFEAYWEIPATEPTAVVGRWVRGPGQALFDALREALGELPIIVEDLGFITPEVEKLRDDNGFPGMKVLQFAFGGDASHPYQPHNFPRNCVVYTGTHDNNTTVGWYAGAPKVERERVRRYLAPGDEGFAWRFLLLAFASVADLALAPLQDVLGLGTGARMNIPGKAAGNWRWRFRWEDMPERLALRLGEVAELYGRVPEPSGGYRSAVTATEAQEGI